MTLHLYLANFFVVDRQGVPQQGTRIFDTISVGSSSFCLQFQFLSESVLWSGSGKRFVRFEPCRRVILVVAPPWLLTGLWQLSQARERNSAPVSPKSLFQLCLSPVMKYTDSETSDHACSGNAAGHYRVDIGVTSALHRPVRHS